MVSLDGFIPPPLPVRMFRDAEGEEIVYGDRWPGSPPEESYSRTSNLDRFEPLIAYAEALIEYLATVADVSVSRDPTHVHKLNPIREADRGPRVIHLAPSSPSAAPLTFALFADFTVSVHAGLATRIPHPVCTCDACDSTAQTEIARLRKFVAAVISGRFHETFTRRGHGYEIEGGGSSWSLTPRPQRRAMRAARKETRRRGPWQPWSPR